MIQVKWLFRGALLILLLWNIDDMLTRCPRHMPFEPDKTEETGSGGRNEEDGAGSGMNTTTAAPGGSADCQGRRIYIYPIPPEFNEELLERCRTGYPRYCDLWPCVPCQSVVDNHGFGPRVALKTHNVMRPRHEDGNEEDEVEIELVPAHAWYRTNQFSLEVIFHERLKAYECRTENAESADAWYMPFYAGIELGFTLFSPHLHVRDERAQRLGGWLAGRNQVWNRRPGGRRGVEFMALGRIAWDFDREPLGAAAWGSSLLRQPPWANVTAVVLERTFWEEERTAAGGNRPPELGAPYPTLFHPRSDAELDEWRAALAATLGRRRWLVSFVGASNRSFDTELVRELRMKLVQQCAADRGRWNYTRIAAAAAAGCKVLDCGGGSTAAGTSVDCEGEPEAVVRAMAASVFCLQPRGDSATRRGFFDAIVAGCIPVVFSPRTAFQQYPYHLTHRNPGPFSVFIPEERVLRGEVDVVRTLSLVPPARVRALQRSVLRLIPNIIYFSHPIPHHDLSNQAHHRRSPDAFSITLDALFSDLPPPPPPSALNLIS